MPFTKANRTDTLKTSAFNLTNGDRRSSKGSSSSLFETLPRELLQDIARLLPISAASSLALCNKYICHVIGPQSWTKLRFEPLELETFLGFFEKDNPGHWLCRSCTIFHLHQRGFRRMSYYTQFHVRKRIWKCMQYHDPFTSCVSRVSSHPSNEINHWMLQMVMNRHLWGPKHGLSL